MKTQLFYNKALDLARRILNELYDDCERIEIAGSLRRKKVSVGDIEIVCIPKFHMDLFGEPHGQSKLDEKLARLVKGGRLVFEKGAERYKQYSILYNGDKIYIDLFITTPDRWGVIFAIRTGSAEFSHRLVTRQSRGGFCPDDMFVADGYIWHHGVRLETPEENDVFSLFGMKYIEPNERN